MLHYRYCNYDRGHYKLLHTLLKVLGNDCFKREGHISFLTVVK